MEGGRTMLIRSMIFVLCTMGVNALAQPLWINISDIHGTTRTMIFGNDARATYGIDKDLGECDGPPLSPGFDIRWYSRRRDVSYDLGLLVYDFIPCPVNDARKDTFILLISEPDEL